MDTAKQLIQASDDIVWDSKEDAYTATRELMLTAMRYCVLPFKVNSTCNWATAQAGVHREHAKALQKILGRIQCADDSLGVFQLVVHHQRIAARYAAVAAAMRD